MDTGTWMDMDRILLSWSMRRERQFIANSIIRYMLPLGQKVQGSHHPHLFTSPEDWVKIKASGRGAFPVPPLWRLRGTGPVDLDRDSSVGSIQVKGKCMDSLWSPLSMWPEGRSTQVLTMVKLSSPSGPWEPCVNIWENAHLRLVLWFNVPGAGRWISILPREGRPKVLAWAQMEGDNRGLHTMWKISARFSLAF